jgi:enhancer of polycomb-like protein
MERDLASQKERDHGYEDVVEVKSYQPHASSTNLLVQNPYQRPTFSFLWRHWKAIFPSLHSSTPSSDVADEEQERVRYICHRLTRLGNAALDRRDALMQHLGIRGDDCTFTTHAPRTVPAKIRLRSCMYILICKCSYLLAFTFTYSHLS